LTERKENFESSGLQVVKHLAYHRLIKPISRFLIAVSLAGIGMYIVSWFVMACGRPASEAITDAVLAFLAIFVLYVLSLIVSMRTIGAWLLFFAISCTCGGLLTVVSIPFLLAFLLIRHTEKTEVEVTESNFERL